MGGSGRRKVRRAPFLLFVWPQRADVETELGLKTREGVWIKKEKKGRREVKGIYCQKPSISGNGYVCFSVNQTCCSLFQHARGEKNNKGAGLRGINRKLMSQHLRLKIRSALHTEKWLRAGLHTEGYGVEVKKVYNARLASHLPHSCEAPRSGASQEHMAKCFPSWLR